MSRGRIRLNLGGGTTKLGSGDASGGKGLKLRKVKKSRVKVARSDAEAATDAPVEMDGTVYSKQQAGKMTPVKRTADKGPAKPTLKRTGSALKSLRPGTGWR